MTKQDASEPYRSDFVYSSQQIEADIHRIAVSKGWWTNPRNDGEIIALIHAELSECLEYLRKAKDAPSDHIPEFLGAEEELADAMIRIMDFAHARGYRLPQAILAKMEFNRNRDFKHGGKTF